MHGDTVGQVGAASEMMPCRRIKFESGANVLKWVDGAQKFVDHVHRISSFLVLLAGKS
jgi:hypothetical protein